MASSTSGDLVPGVLASTASRSIKSAQERDHPLQVRDKSRVCRDRTEVIANRVDVPAGVTRPESGATGFEIDVGQ